ncbi:hypothetical protein [Nonomuraea dietziae]
MADGDMVGAGVRVRTVMLDAGEWVIATATTAGGCPDFDYLEILA